MCFRAKPRCVLDRVVISTEAENGGELLDQALSLREESITTVKHTIILVHVGLDGLHLDAMTAITVVDVALACVLSFEDGRVIACVGDNASTYNYFKSFSHLSLSNKL